MKKILTNIYLKFSKLYVFLFGRKKMQFINDIIFSLSLDAKGFKHYGHLFNSGEKSFIKLIKNEVKSSSVLCATTKKKEEKKMMHK